MRYVVLVILVLGAFALLGCVKQTAEACGAMAAGNDRNQCFRAVAKAQNDTSLCASIDDAVLKNYWCYREIAYDTRDASLCEKISDNTAKTSCYAVLNGSQKFERGVRQ